MGLRRGSVIWRKFCQLLAPSTLAASITSMGREYRPAIYITTAYPKSFQIVITITAGSARLGSFSQLILVPSIWLTTPICGLYINFHTKATATIGVTTGI